MKIKYEIFKLRIISIIPFEKDITDLQNVFEHYPYKLGKTPKELKAKSDGEKITLRYDFHIDYNSPMNGPFGVHSIVNRKSKQTLELSSSYESITPEFLIIITLLYFGLVPLMILKIVASESDFPFLPIPANSMIIFSICLTIYSLMYLRAMVNLKDVHKTSIRLIKRSMAISNEKNYT